MSLFQTFKKTSFPCNELKNDKKYTCIRIPGNAENNMIRALSILVTISQKTSDEEIRSKTSNL